MTLVDRLVTDIRLGNAQASARTFGPPLLTLLGGGASLGAFAKAVGRSVLDLPLTAEQSILSLWRKQAGEIPGRLTSSRLQILVVGGDVLQTAKVLDDSLAPVEHMADPKEHRGTGGVLRDIAADYPDEARLLVSSGATILLEPLGALLEELLATGADAAFFICDDDSASSLMLLRCGCLRSIPAIGFVDLKEQAMPLIASSHSVTLVRRSFPVSISVRTPMQYILGLRAYHQQCRMRPTGQGLNSNASESPFAEQWRPLFQIVEPHARVGEGVRLHDAVVLNGATVGNNAVVVRSVVCPGAVVPANARIVDQLVRSTNDNRKPNLKRSASDR